MGPLQSAYYLYHTKYPNATKEEIANYMLQDKIITSDIAEKISSGMSLMLIDEQISKRPDQNLNINVTEILGGEFSKKLEENPKHTERTIPKEYPSKQSALIMVDKEGNVLPHQFKIEYLKNKYNSEEYRITQKKDKYDWVDITIINKKTGEKLVYEIGPEQDCSLLSTHIDVTKYDKKGNAYENAFIEREKNNTCYIGKIQLQNKDIFYNKDGTILKTYDYKKNKKGEWEPSKVTLYSDNKPYKVMEGDYDTLIENFPVYMLSSLMEKPTPKPDDLIKISQIINKITEKNVYEMLFDYKNESGRDLLDDLKKLADNKQINLLSPYPITLLNHVKECMKYNGWGFNDSWLNKHQENVLVDRMINCLMKGNIDDFRETLKFAGIDLTEEERTYAVELFGNVNLRKILLIFQEKSEKLYKNTETDKGLTKGLLYTIAKSEKISPEDKANLLLDTISQLGFLNDKEMRKELFDFTRSDEFLNLITAYCTQGKYCEDILNDIKLNRNNPDKVLVDLKRLKARNSAKKENSKISKPNGKIDIDFKQGNTGDCWLLAGVVSIVKKEHGKNSLESLLKVDEKTGDVIVTLKGAKKTYKITYEEIKNANHLSSGDGDMRALELALDKYIRDLAHEGKTMYADNVDINGNTTYYLYEVLFGNGKDIGKYRKTMNEDFNASDKYYCLGTSILNCSYSDTREALLDENDNPVDFIANHAYAVIKADEKYVYLVNPWNSKETLRITHEKLEKICPFVGECSY